MLATLFAIILLTFIGVGLPDSVLGTAWPSMYREMGLPISLAGYISSTISLGTIISSLLAARLIRRFGTGTVSAVSTLLTAVALLGFAYTKHAPFFFLLSIPLGIGAGAIDIALNNFVALHYSASKMSFLHAFYGLGVALSPFIMSLALGENGDWRKGYFVVALLQFLLALIAFAALPLWKKVDKREASSETQTKPLSFVQVLKIPAARWSALAFFTYCALELTAGSWASSYFVNTKEISPDKAALVTLLFYVGLTLGRILSGIFANKLGRRRILRISLYVLPVALVLFVLPLPTWLAAVSLFLIGLSDGPIYPNLSHLTPKFFGKENSESVMAVQQAFTYIGILVMPWLFGVLAQLFSTALLPYYLAVLGALYAWIMISLFKAVKKQKVCQK